MKEYLSQLNPPQQQAVEYTEGPLMVIAGAGSGKTRVLTYRIAHLMEKGVDPFNILALTFTNKAAREMKERIASVVGESEAKNLWMGTFHSIFARLLRFEGDRLGFPSNFTIYDTQDAQSVLKKVINDLQLDKDVYKVKAVAHRISQYKNNLITVKAYFNNPELMEADAASMKPHLGTIYKAYVERCFRAGAMDFDDLLLRTNELLTRFPEVLAKYQDRFKYILVDEYQDTNHSQYLIVKALASRFENICVVGDDAQSIYSFRGANIQNILNFKNDYPDAVTIPLEQNYRSSGHIVNAANSIIAKNQNQLKKDVWTQNPEGDPIKIYRALSDADEANFVANTIFETMHRHQMKPADFAILYRTNAQSRALEEALRKKNIAYRVYGGLSFFQRKEIKDVVAYLRLMVNPKDEEALLRVINYPKRGIGNSTLNKLLVVADKENISLNELIADLPSYASKINLSGAVIHKLQQFWEMIEGFRVMVKNNPLHEATMYIAQNSGLIKLLKEDETPEGISRIENIQELVNSMQGFIEEQEQLEDGNPSLEGFLENIALATDADNDKDDSEKVSLMTIHLAKGLEYPEVFVVGLEENLFPSMQSMYSREDIEEERRLFYVAVTRAEQKAYLSYALTRFRWGKVVDGEPSRFIEEIEEEYVEFLNSPTSKPINTSGLDADIFGDDIPTIKIKKYPQPKLKPIQNAKAKDSNGKTDIDLKVGDTVRHDRFGVGRVQSLEGDVENAKAIILFDNVGEKNLLLKFAKLKIL